MIWGFVLNNLNIDLDITTFNGHIGTNLHPLSVSTVLKELQKDLKIDTYQQPLSGHSIKVGAAIDLLEQGEPLERIMLEGG